MSNKEIEEMLHDAKELLPKTEAKWQTPQVEPVNTKAWHKSRALAACLAGVFLLVLGGGTVWANMEMDIAPGEYEQWTGTSGTSLGDYNIQLGMRNVFLPQSFGSYGFSEYSSTYVAQHGTTYWEAMTKNVYNPLWVCYADAERKDRVLAISVGTIENDWWQEYYGFEKVGSVWKAKEYTKSFSYCGITIYGVADADSMNWKWIDEKNKNCWSVVIPFSSELDGPDIANRIIASNTTAWPEHIVYVDNQGAIFEGFSLADYRTEDGVSPALYNGKTYVVFYDGAVKIIDEQSQESYEISVADSVYRGLEWGGVFSKMYDVNGDGVDEIVLSSSEKGTNMYLHFLDVIDLKNQTKIPLDYSVEMLVEKMPQIEIIEEKLDEKGEREAVVIRYQMGDREYTHAVDLTHVICKDDTFRLMPSENDARFFCENGNIRVETMIGFSDYGNYLEDVLGTLVANLVYEPETQSYVLDEYSVRIEWNE